MFASMIIWLFFAFLLIFLCGWAIFIPTSSQLVRDITQEFAFYGLVSLVATVGRALTSAHNHPGRYAAWSYTLAGAYLAVIIFWLLTLKHLSPQGVRYETISETPGWRRKRKDTKD